jgi:DNA polymerase III epsilon subunit-like protein
VALPRRYYLSASGGWGLGPRPHFGGDNYSITGPSHSLKVALSFATSFVGKIGIVTAQSPLCRMALCKRIHGQLESLLMRRLLFFDVETTGTDKVNDRVVQIAWILADGNGQSLIERSFILKPDGYKIPQSVAKIHGITQEMADAKGVPRVPVMQEYVRTAAESSLLVAHNIDFDIALVRSECRRLGLPRSFDSTPMQCTMKGSTAYCGLSHLSGKKGFKWPRLEELHYKLFDCYFSGAHNALVDVQITKKCYFELKNRGVI